MIKLSQIVWELWPALTFSFRGDKLTKIVRVASYACDMPTGPSLHSYQILSKYVKGIKDASTEGRHADPYILRTYRSADKMYLGFKLLTNRACILI